MIIESLKSLIILLESIFKAYKDPSMVMCDISNSGIVISDSTNTYDVSINKFGVVKFKYMTYREEAGYDLAFDFDRNLLEKYGNTDNECIKIHKNYLDLCII